MPEKKGNIWILKGIGILLLCGIGAQLLFSFVLLPMLNQGIRSWVHTNSKGLYRIEQMELSIHVFDQRLQASGVQLRHDSSLVATMLPENRPQKLLEIDVPQLEINLSKAWKAWRKGGLSLRSVLVVKPVVRVFSQLKHEKQQPQTDFRVENWYALLSPYLDFLVVEELRLEGGSLRLNDGPSISENSFVAEEIFVFIRNFRLDSTTLPGRDRLFFAEEVAVEMGVDNYAYVFPDSTYEVRMGKLGISTAQSEIYVRDLQLLPNYRKYRAGNSLLEMQIPRLQLLGCDLYAALFDRQLRLRSARILEPKLIQIGSIQTDSLASPDLDQSQVFAQLSPYLSSILVDTISIERANVVRMEQPGDSLYQVDLRGLSCLLENFRLDSTSLQEERLFWSDELSVELASYRLQLAKDSYALAGKELQFSTASGRLSSGEIGMRPQASLRKAARIKGKDLLSFRIPGVEIEGLKLAEVWFQRRLEVDRFQITQPRVSLTNFTKVNPEQVDSLARADWYGLIGDYLESVTIREFSLNQGEFILNSQANQQQFSASDLSISIENFQLNDSAKQRRDNPFYADQLNLALNISDYSFVLPDSSYAVQIKHIDISASDSVIVADSVYLLPLLANSGPGQALEQELEVFIPRVRLAGMDANQSYFERVIALDSLYLSHPKIRIHSPQAQSGFSLPPPDSIQWQRWIKGSLEALVVRNLHIDSAQVFLEQQEGDQLKVMELPQVSLFVEDFLLDSASRITDDHLFYAGNIRLEMGQLQLPLPDSLHEVAIGQLSLSTRNRNLRLQNLHLTPKAARSGEKGQQADIQLPTLDFQGVDWFPWWVGNRLHVALIRLVEPNIQLARNLAVDSTQIESFAEGDWSQLILDQLQSLSVDQFHLSNGRFALNTSQAASSNAFSAEDLQLRVQGFLLDSSTQRGGEVPFEVSTIRMRMNVDDYALMLPDSSYEVRVAKLGISTADSSIFAQQVQLIPHKVAPDQPRLTGLIPQLRISGIRPKEIFFERKLRLTRLLAEQPEMRWDAPLTPKEQPEAFSLYDLLSPHLKQIDIQAIDIEEAYLGERGPNPSMPPLKQLSVHLSGIHLDSLPWIRPGRLFYSDQSHFYLKNYSFPLVDSLYILEAGNWHYSTQEGLIEGDSIRFRSALSLNEFYVQNQYSKSHLDLRLKHLEGSRLDAHAFFEDEMLELSQVLLEDIEMEVEKDRQYPEEPNRRPPLLQDLLRRLPVGLKIDSLAIEGGSIIYLERPKETNRQALFFMDDLQAQLLDLSNLPQATPSKAQTILSAQARLMGVGQMEVVLTYWLADSSKKYSIDGLVDGMDLSLFNPTLEPTAAVTVKSGQLNRLRFQLQANVERSRGKMWMEYDDLQVALIEASEHKEAPIKRRRMISLLANTLVVRKNPKRRFLRVGRIRYEMDPSKSFIGHWLQAILSGVKSSIGLENKDEKDRSLGWRFLLKNQP